MRAHRSGNITEYVMTVQPRPPRRWRRRAWRRTRPPALAKVGGRGPRRGPMGAYGAPGARQGRVRRHGDFKVRVRRHGRRRHVRLPRLTGCPNPTACIVHNRRWGVITFPLARALQESVIVSRRRSNPGGEGLSSLDFALRLWIAWLRSSRWWPFADPSLRNNVPKGAAEPVAAGGPGQPRGLRRARDRQGRYAPPPAVACGQP